jgi:hypothetical protein
MNTYFVYIHDAKFPKQIGGLLTEVKAEKFSEKSHIIKTEKPLDEIMWDFKRFMARKGFVLMIDSSFPDKFHIFPEENRKKLSRLDPDLDKIVLQWQSEFLGLE